MADDHDFFSDDDLDAIPSNTLDQLEQHAVSSTQRQPQPQPPTHATALHRPSNHINSPAQNRTLPWRPPQPNRTASAPTPNDPPASAPDAPSSDYGFDDEDVIDLDEPSMVIQPTLSKPQLDPNPFQSRRFDSKAHLDPETAAAYAAADAELSLRPSAQWQQHQHQQQHYTRQYQSQHHGHDAEHMNVEALRGRIAELETEQARLRFAEQEARSEVLARQGEIAIIRSNQEKSTKQLEARMLIMQRLHAEENAKHKAELDTQRKERERMETNNRFLQHDLAQETERAKRAHPPATRSRAAPPTQRETPRKNKRTTLGDGFDEDEIRLVSPSKSKEKARGQTPKAGAKRKRAVNDSPAAGLSFPPLSPPPLLPSVSHGSGLEQDRFGSFPQPAVEHKARDHHKYAHMQLILNRAPYEGHERTVEALAKYTFPSRPEKTLSSIFLDKIVIPRPARPDEEEHIETLAPMIVRASLDLWSQCLTQRFFAPLYLIRDMLRFAMQSERPSSLAQFIEQAIPLFTESIEIVARNIARFSIKRGSISLLDRKSLDELAEELDIDEILDLLHTLCQSASLSAERTEVFWRTIDTHFVFVMLSKAQPIRQITTMLRMIELSVRPTTFSTIPADLGKQTDQEKLLIDRLTNLLFETPEVPQGEEPYADEEILELRIAVLQVFKTVCQTEHGTLVMTQQRSALGRLVRFLDAQVSQLYRVPPTFGLLQSPRNDQPRRPHDLIAETVNRTMRLVHHVVVRTLDHPTALVQKMHAVHGGYHKMLTCLTRLAFSEQLVLEHGIDDQASEAAHHLLHNILSPEEGKTIKNVMETPRGTRGSTTEENTTTNATTSSASTTTNTGLPREDEDIVMGDVP